MLDERKQKNMVRREKSEYNASRYRSKAKKYQQKTSTEYTYKQKKAEVMKKEEKKEVQKVKSCICFACGKVYTR